MYGVVLWCSADSRKAVIWCEDHGDLAFYEDVAAQTALDPGDLVKFRSEQTRRRRLARDLELIEQDRFRNLPDDLKAAGRVHPASNTPENGKVVRLCNGRDARGAQAKPAPRQLVGV
ncbi:hypothetical protein M8756_09525 [Lutimaribacter sp. EGI FJ00015]|uniref:Uncharacterized protein n=1 Tax=Lutimaribacter degradans TaxID=2945989 RepID=A0ACC5ZVK2_9RHOB|nr:hypothetical protein [Lutimaribacter sp. EGI FJ00013]MCM2562388.1 hypothetical protein [Lutimaribacter sp. EGI FJ00013]MCO0613545.1 hypothetical protein [Lutimaribacter sp. EGI FJ00015]MCO0636517.1 hypothetical protein [Lutimaribacter sp. EGI FJ00014]